MRKFSVSVLICLGLLALGSPAYAHNQLIATSPSAGSSVEAGPVKIDLTFEEAPMALPFGEGNLIAVANADTGKQLGGACATIEGDHLITTANLYVPGKYKVLWRQVSDDGHVVSGDFTFTLTNTSLYSTDKVGNQCFDRNGKELDVSTQRLLSKAKQTDNGFSTGLVWSTIFILLGSLVGAVQINRRKK
jgi:hypothetical protein